jgi:hypothetical protein
MSVFCPIQVAIIEQTRLRQPEIPHALTALQASVFPESGFKMGKRIQKLRFLDIGGILPFSSQSNPVKQRR